MSEQQPGKTRSRVTLFILIGVFAAPIIGAYLAHKYKALQPVESKSFGEIISPAKALPRFKLTTGNGEAFGFDDIRQKWAYIYVIDSLCDEACKLSLLKMRNARLGQGAEARRVRYYLVVNQKPDDLSVFAELVKEHPKLTFLYGSDAELKSIYDTFRDDDERAVVNARRVYLIDPAGNYMMYYNDGFESIGIMEDLKHLLKWSQIG